MYEGSRGLNTFAGLCSFYNLKSGILISNRTWIALIGCFCSNQRPQPEFSAYPVRFNTHTHIAEHGAI
ncbi:hypothetical protein CRENBAI_015463 [Crenichthys baileyi]|uniref:Uncharacterized protein n=1 Tax=Crenichthys baileyi TaxID=28760 RepID=A0AAV9RR98_9TELE